MSRHIYRYQIPADGQEHDVLLSGPIRTSGSRVAGTVEFWAEHDSDVAPITRRLFVAGTGWPLPDRARYVHSTFDASTTSIVWHLIEVCSEDPQSHPADRNPGSCPVCWPHQP